MQRSIRAPVDRDRDARRQAAHRLRRALGIHVLAAPELCAPPPDRNEGEIELGDEFLHAVEEIRVAREEDTLRAEDRVAERRPFAEGRPTAFVLRVGGANGHRAHGDLVALVDGNEVKSAETAREEPRGDNRRPTTDELQRREVEVVVVPVRDQDGVGGRRLVVQRHGAPEVCYPPPQERVGEQAHAVQLDEHRAVPDVANDHPDGTMTQPARPAISTVAMGRMLLVRTLVVVGALFTILSLVAGYVRFQALDTDSVGDLAGDLIADPEIREQAAATLVEQLFANVDVEAALNERLPPDQRGLAGPIAGGIRLGADRVAQRLLERPRAQELWVRTIEATHRNLLRILEDETGPVSTEGGDLVLDLQPILIQLGEQVAIVGRIDERLRSRPDAGRITIVQADQLETAQDLTQILKVLGLWLWLVPIVLWAIALWLAEGRRRVILRMIGISSIITGLLVLVIRRLAGSAVVDELARPSRSSWRPRMRGTSSPHSFATAASPCSASA